MATSCMLPNPMTCCASCDVTADTLHDAIPLRGALRDVITLSSQCHGLMAPTQAITSSAPHRVPSPLLSAMGVSQHSDDSLQGPPSPAPSPPRSRSPPRAAAAKHVSSSATSVHALVSGGDLSVSEDEVNQLPLLKVSSKELRYRGEGAEHIVLRVLTSVLRIRKTAVGATSSKKDLVIRAKKDEEFLHNVARPILGPLLTDESRLVCLDASTVQELRDTLAPLRQVHRRHKGINNEGVACICPDAASIFISRKSSTLSSSPASSNSSSASSCFSPSPLLSHDVIISSSSSSRVSSEQVSSSVQEPHYNGQDIQLIPRMNFSSREISQGAKAGKNLRNTQPSSTSSLPNDSSPSEVENSSCSELKKASLSEWQNVEEADCPTNSLHSTSSISVNREPRNICIEIKPKQGFIDTSTPELPLCRYCVKQHIKVGKDADHATSCYCPLDLFSGNLTRMRKAVDGLFESPQNNFKVFLDGEPVENCLSFRYLRDIIIAALTYDFRTPRVELHENGPLNPCSPLGRTLGFQMLDKLGVYCAANMYRYLVKIMGDSKAADALLQDLKCWTGDSQFCQASSKICTRCFQEDSKQVNGVSDVICRGLIDKGSHENEHEIFYDPSTRSIASDHLEHDIGSCLNPKLNQEHSLSITNIKRIPEHIVSGEFFIQDDIIRKLQEYLLSTTAKDLSLMILLSGPYRSTPVPHNAVNASPFIIELDDSSWYRCQVTGVDLVAKPPSKILKHEQDYVCLKAVLEDLQKQGKKPACCK
ncbi:uncharacterized protein LOC135215386 isoform X2 [Macrobrachium nipponense]|uniref:uncharacterized protein LOC135215386 isoform X2 n=1 Tax=Macrobrachium nipponense TaxID=159736 RepID=UPI0030C865A2